MPSLCLSRAARPAPRAARPADRLGFRESTALPRTELNAIVISTRNRSAWLHHQLRAALQGALHQQRAARAHRQHGYGYGNFDASSPKGCSALGVGPCYDASRPGYGAWCRAA